MLAFVAATARSIPCLLLATYRADELPRADIAALARAGTTLMVPPLDDDAAGTLLARSVGGDVTAAAAAVIVERSAGNPLFVSEYGQLLAATGRRDVAPGAVPIVVAAVIERRLARIQQDALRVAPGRGRPRRDRGAGRRGPRRRRRRGRRRRRVRRRWQPSAC